jgi:cysteine desulfurase family protein (TIGR01976 family)
MDAAKERLAAWLNVGVHELHFGPSSSQNTYVVAQALRACLEPGDEVIVTNQDHEANIGAWSRLQDAGILVREWKVDADTAELRTGDLQTLLGPRTRAVAFTHCSNIVGSINPARDWTDIVHRAGARAIVDGVSFCPHGSPDLRELGADVYFFSLYKMYGPHLGVMYVRDDFQRELPNQGHFFNETRAAYRLTPAGPDHAQIAAVNGVIEYLEAIAGRHAVGGGSATARAQSVQTLFRGHETVLLQPLLDFLADHPRIRLIGKRRADMRAPTVAFTVDGHRSADIARRLADSGLGLGAGHFYAYRLVQALGLDPEDGVVRASFVHYTNADEVARLIAALDAIV